MVTIGVDEMTIVVLLKDKKILSQRFWDVVAEGIIQQIEAVLKLKMIFGSKQKAETSNIQGYNKGYTYGEHSFYFRVCYHEYENGMGVAIRFSAQSLLYYKTKYQELYGKIVEPYEIIGNLTNALDYTVRLSRIDLYADFINEEDIAVDDLRKDLESGKYQVYSNSINKNVQFYKKTNSNLTYTTKNGVVNTMYIGSKNKGTTSLLRIYNKKLEQISKHGARYDEAIDCKSWVRFENEIHGKYAHDLTNVIREIDNTDQLGELIASCILNKYTIKDEEGNSYEATRLLEKMRQDNDYHFKNVKYNDHSLKKQLDYLTNKTGLISFMHKLDAIDSEQIWKFLWYLKIVAEDRKPNRDTKKWLRAHEATVKKNGIHLFDDCVNAKNEKGCQPSLTSFAHKSKDD